MPDPRPFAWLVTQDDLDGLPRVYRDDPLLVGDADAVPITAAVVPPDEDDEDRFAPEVLDELRRLGDTFGPLGVAIAAASLTDAQALTAAIRDGHTGEQANVAGLYATIDDLRRAGRAAETAHLRDAAEWDRRSAQGREQVDRLVASNDDLRRQLAAEREAAEEQADALRSEVARLSGLLDGEAAELRSQLLRTVAERDEALRRQITNNVAAHPVQEIHVDGAGIVRCDARELRFTRDADGQVTRQAFDGPNRPHPGANAWPDDAVTVTYSELRRLIALHLDTLARTLGKLAPWEDCRRTARAVRDGEVPLLLSEVLDRA